MQKFTPTENKKHWDKYAKHHKNALSGASYDANLADLENYFIISGKQVTNPSDVGIILS